MTLYRESWWSGKDESTMMMVGLKGCILNKMTDKKDKTSQQATASKRVVVTYGKKPVDDKHVPEDILPKLSSEVISSPVGADESPLEIDEPTFSETLKSHVHRNTLPQAIQPHYKTSSYPPQQSSFEVPDADKPNSDSASSSAAPPPPPPPPSSVADQTNNGGMAANTALFLSFVASVVVGVLGYYVYLSQNALQKLHETQQNERHSVESLISTANQRFNTLVKFEERNNNKLVALQQLQNQLNASQQQLSVLLNNQDWVLAEIRYLVAIADEQLTLGNVPTALAQLKAAEQRLTQLPASSLESLRTALSTDIETLSAQTPRDVQLLWQRLEDLSEPLRALEFNFRNERLSPKQDTEKEVYSSAWQHALNDTWQQLKDFIRITKESDASLPKTLSVSAQTQVTQTVQLLLVQAQWSVLMSNQSVYVKTLDKIDNLIKSYYKDTQARQTLLSQIQQLKSIDVAKPSVTLRSLQQLNSL